MLCIVAAWSSKKKWYYFKINQKVQHQVQEFLNNVYQNSRRSFYQIAVHYYSSF